MNRAAYILLIICVFSAANTVWNADAPHAASQEPNKPEKQSNFSYADTQINAMAKVIRLYGYDCLHVENAFPKIFSRGFDVFAVAVTGRPTNSSWLTTAAKWQVTAD